MDSKRLSEKKCSGAKIKKIHAFKKFHKLQKISSTHSKIDKFENQKY